MFTTMSEANYNLPWLAVHISGTFVAGMPDRTFEHTIANSSLKQ